MLRFETSLGAFSVELFDKEAPRTVANFLKYVEDEFFDGTIFHRIVPGFVIQGGGMEPGPTQKTTRPPIQNEATNGLENLRGTLSMARYEPGNSGASFFFCMRDDPEFDEGGKRQPDGSGFCAFGEVVSGFDAMERLFARAESEPWLKRRIAIHRVHRLADQALADDG